MDSSTDTNHEYGKHAIKKTCTDYPIYTLKLILFNNILFQVFGGTVVNFVTVLILNVEFNVYINPFLGLSEFSVEFLTARNSSVTDIALNLTGPALNQTLSNY